MLSVDTAPPVSREFRPNTDSEPDGRSNMDFELTLQAERQQLDAPNTDQPNRPKSTTAADGIAPPEALAVQEIEEGVETDPENDPLAYPVFEISQRETDSIPSDPQDQKPVQAEPAEVIPTLETIEQPDEEITAIFFLAENAYLWQNLPTDVPGQSIAAEQRTIEPVTTGALPADSRTAALSVASELANLLPGPASVAEIVSDARPSQDPGTVAAVTDSARRTAGDIPPLTQSVPLTVSAPEGFDESGLTIESNSARSDAPPTASAVNVIRESAPMAAVLEEMVLIQPTETTLMEQTGGGASAALPDAEAGSIAEAVAAMDVPGSSRDEIRREIHARNTVDRGHTEESGSALDPAGSLADSETEGYKWQQGGEGKHDPRATPISHGKSGDQDHDPQIDRLSGEGLANADGPSNIHVTNLSPAHHNTSVSGHREFSDSLKGEEVLLGNSEQWNQIEKSSVVSQVLEKVRLFRAENNSEIVISLKPESLGRISLRASIVDHTIVATIIAESEKVKNLLEFELPLLHRTLQQHGMPARVEVLQGTETNTAFHAGGQSHSSQNPSFKESQDKANSWILNNAQGQDPDPAVRPDISDSRYVSRSIHLIA